MWRTDLRKLFFEVIFRPSAKVQNPPSTNSYGNNFLIDIDWQHWMIYRKKCQRLQNLTSSNASVANIVDYLPNLLVSIKKVRIFSSILWEFSKYDYDFTFSHLFENFIFCTRNKILHFGRQQYVNNIRNCNFWHQGDGCLNLCFSTSLLDLSMKYNQLLMEQLEETTRMTYIKLTIRENVWLEDTEVYQNHGSATGGGIRTSQMDES